MKIKILIIAISFFIINVSLTSGAFIKQSKISNENSSVEVLSGGDRVVTRRALIIGVDNYVYSDKDAIELKNSLSSKGWDESNINILINEEANKDNILSALDLLAEQEDSDDIVIFYFSGHGDEACIYSYDDRAINIIDLDTKFDNFESKKVILIFDCCFSGSMPNEDSDTQTNLIIKNFKINNKSSLEKNDYDSYGGLAQLGRIILTACNSTEYSYADSLLENGIFSYFLIDGFNGLNNSDLNKDGWISIKEAFRYAKPRTISYIEQYDLKQHPQMYNGCFRDIKITKINEKSSFERVKLPNLLITFLRMHFKLIDNLVWA